MVLLFVSSCLPNSLLCPLLLVGSVSKRLRTGLLTRYISCLVFCSRAAFSLLLFLFVLVFFERIAVGRCSFTEFLFFAICFIGRKANTTCRIALFALLSCLRLTYSYNFSHYLNHSALFVASFIELAALLNTSKFHQHLFDLFLSSLSLTLYYT